MCILGRLKNFLSKCTVPSSYNCTHMCDFSRGTTRFYSLSEVQIHAWFRPMATHGSQRGYKYDHVWVAEAVLVHAWVVLITTGVLYQRCVSIQSLLHGSVLATTSKSTWNTLVIVSSAVLLFVLQCLYSDSRAWTNLVQAKWRAWLTLDNA